VGLFVTVQINEKLCPQGCTLCMETCPMKIFRTQNGMVVTDFDAEDECTFCNMCMERCTAGAISIIKNYL